jgi:uncharacterized glyoxalase superfamily protein PhnB
MNPSHEQPTGTVNRSMPPGVVIPELAYADVREAVTWLCRVFGFRERLRIGDHRAQLVFGEGSIVVTKVGGEVGTQGHAVMVRVADVDGHYERAKEAGATVVSAPTDYPYGERQYGVEDLGGHRWTFSQMIADVDPSRWGGEWFE